MPLEPSSLPDIQSIRLRAKALAMVEAIISPDWESRYYSYNASWGEGEEMASMRNGSGDDWFLLIGTWGAAIKGLAHETPLAKDNSFADEVQRQVPESFSSFLKEPAFGMDWVSFCYWRGSNDSSWQKVKANQSSGEKLEDGSEELLALLVGPASSYIEFASWYYETEVPLALVERLYQQEPLTEELVQSINPELDFSEAQAFAEEIGYPCA